MNELRQRFPHLFQDIPERKQKPAGAGYNQMRRSILDWARDNNFVIHPCNGYSYYVLGFAQNDSCICDPGRKVCPCPESITEVKEQGWCKCRLFWRDLDTFKDTFIPEKPKGYLAARE